MSTIKIKNLLDEKWEVLFEELPILERISETGYFDITSKEINTVREARLMTKFDHKNTLPKIFKKNKLSILPTARGKYRISTFDLYKEFPRASWEKRVKAKPFIIPPHLHTLTHDMLSSESVALNAAYSSLVLQDFTGEENLLPTASGRMGTGDLKFDVSLKGGGKHNLIVKKAQMEIDGCFEGLNTIALIEAKNKFSEDFLIRQLYYPYNYWAKKVTKRIRPIFQVFSNDTLFFFEYEFEDPNFYNSMKLKRQAQYRLEDRVINISEIHDLLKSITPTNKQSVQCPQADRFERIINMFEEITDNNGKTQNDITEYFGFDVRQTQYYFAALKFLNISVREKNSDGVTYMPTKIGKSIRKLPFADRQLAYARKILEHQIFYDAIKIYFDTGQIIDQITARNLMVQYEVKGASSESTLNRRAQTIIAWTKWIIQLANDE